MCDCDGQTDRQLQYENGSSQFTYLWENRKCGKLLVDGPSSGYAQTSPWSRSPVTVQWWCHVCSAGERRGIRWRMVLRCLKVCVITSTACDWCLWATFSHCTELLQLKTLSSEVQLRFISTPPRTRPQKSFEYLRLPLSSGGRSKSCSRLGSVVQCRCTEFSSPSDWGCRSSSGQLCWSDSTDNSAQEGLSNRRGLILCNQRENTTNSFQVELMLHVMSGTNYCKPKVTLVQKQTREEIKERTSINTKW